MSDKRILFVDDEQSILDGLSNLLRKQRKRWLMRFALGAEAALAELGTASYDVVVTDMRMPGMDGAALLRKVKESYPGAARIVLSGHAERESVMAALPVAHQFLSKPCTGEVLTAVIERTCELQALLHSAQVREVIGRLDKLPSAPATYLELVRVASDPDAGIGEITHIVESDPAMSIKVLQLVNSAFFGLAHRMASVAKAVTYLGIDLIKALALNAHVFGVLEDSGVPGFSLERLQRRSLLCARLASRFVADKKCSETAMTAALVKDAGKIILCQTLREGFVEVVRTVQESGRPFHVVERERFGVTHAEVGAYLLGVWGLPFDVVEAVAYHHRPPLVPRGTSAVLAAVHVATALVDELERGGPPPDPEGGLDLAFLERVGLAGQFAEWKALAEREFAALAADKGATR